MVASLTLQIDASMGVPALGLRSTYENLLLAYENYTIRGEEGDACLRGMPGHRYTAHVWLEDAYLTR